MAKQRLDVVVDQPGGHNPNADRDAAFEVFSKSYNRAGGSKFSSAELRLMWANLWAAQLGQVSVEEARAAGRVAARGIEVKYIWQTHEENDVLSQLLPGQLVAALIGAVLFVIVVLELLVGAR